MTGNTKVTTVLELALLVIRNEILGDTTETDQEIVDELANCRATELLEKMKQGEKITYQPSANAFTCEICSDNIIIIKHSSIDDAIRYAIGAIADISVIYKDNVVLFGGYSDGTAYWKYKDESSTYTVSIADIKEKAANLEYQTVEIKEEN